MSSLTRKIKRKQTKDAEKEMAEKVGMFDRLGDNCVVCQKPFDKTNREQVMSWNVVVREREKKVNLYCPTCWETAQKVLKDFKQHIEGRG